MKLTQDHLRKLAEEAADNVSSPGTPAAREHNIKTILHALEEAAKSENKACCDAVNSLVVRGNLSGNGCDATAERNGLVRATNIISS